MKKLSACFRLRLALTLLVALVFATPVLRAANVVANTNNAVTAQLQSTLDYMAQAFDTGSNAMKLTSITVRLLNTIGTSRADVQLWTSPLTNTTPVTLVEDLGDTINFSAFTNVDYTVTSPANPVLAAGTRYWVVVHSSSGAGGFDWRNTSSGAISTDVGATLPLLRATGNGTTWTPFSPANYQFIAVAGSFVVTTTNDSGAGSLRQALAAAAAAPGADTITFATNLSGMTIQLTNSFSTSDTYTNNRSSLLIANDTGGVTVDATALPGGLTLSDNGNSTYRLLHITNSTVTLRGLTFKDGGIATYGSSSGGAIFSSASTVTIERCTFTGNIADGGGAIYNENGPMTLRHCTLTGNTTTVAPGVGTGGDGGAIFNNFGPMSLIHCTVVSNTAPNGAGGTGGIISYLGTISLTNCIIAGNTINSNTTPGDIRYHSSTLVIAGTNIIPAAVNAGTLVSNGVILTNAPLLSAFANWGGGTRTFYPLPGSPARDAASVVAGLTTDQRGATLPASGRDIGAVETGASVPGLSLAVTTTADEFNGLDANGVSLREALTLTLPGGTITFATNLAGLAVTLTNDLAVANLTLLTTVGATNVNVAVNAGTLSFQGGSVWTGGGQILLGATSGTAAATVEVNGPDNFTLAAPITVRTGSSGTKTLRAANVGNGLLNSGLNTFAGAITLLAPATVERVNGSGFQEIVDFTGPMDLGANVLTVNANDDVYFSGSVGRSDGTGTAQLVKTGIKPLFLRGTNDNPRLTATVNGGDLYLDKTSSASVHALGSGLPAGTTVLTVAGGAFVYVGFGGSGGDQIADTASMTVDGSLFLDASETLDALNGGGTVTPNFSSTLTLGAGNGSGTFTGSLNNGVLNLSLTKTGTGTQTVAGGSMRGALTVSNGTLNVLGSLPNLASATVASGATLAGTGTVANLTLQPGSFLAPGNATNAASIGTLNVGGGYLSWYPGATARFHLSNTTNTSDKVAIASELLKISGGTYTFDFQNTGAPGQIYTLATFAESDSLPTSFSSTNLAPGLAGTFTLGGNSLTFTTVTVPKPTVTGPLKLGNGAMRLTFTNLPAVPFTVLASTNVALPLSNWTTLGATVEAPPGQYQFTDPQATNFTRRFYRIRTP